MTYAEAVQVLGFREKDVILPHLPVFRNAERKLAELIQQAESEELRANYRHDLALLQEALRVVETERSLHPRRRRGWAAVLLLFSLMVVGGMVYGGWRANEGVLEKRAINLEKDLQVLAASGAAAIEKRRWPEAEEVYAKIESLQPGSTRAKEGMLAIAAGKEEERRQQIGFFSGTAIAAIEARSWKSAEDTLLEILKLDPKNAKVPELRERIKEGRYLDRLLTIQDAAEEAIREEAWEELARHAQELERLDSKHADLSRLRKLAADGMVVMEERKVQAREMYQKALALDDGTYSEEALDLLRDALRLSRQAEYEVLYEKISSHARTLRVPEKYETIAAALADAREQDKVRVGEGVFVENLNLPAGVDLEGAGREKTIIESPAEVGSVILVGAAAKEIRLASLTVRFVGISVAEERFPVIAVDGGEVSIEDVWVENGSGHGIAVIAGGQAALRSVRVIKSGWDGLAVYGVGSKANVLESRFDQNLHHGVDAWNGGGVIVRKSRFSSNGLTGLVMMSPGVMSRVETSVSEKNRELGILVANQSVGEVVGNEITGNLLGGIVVKDAQTRVEIANNTVTKNEKAGILVDRNVSVIRFENNKASGNEGIQVDLKAELEDPEE